MLFYIFQNNRRAAIPRPERRPHSTTTTVDSTMAWAILSAAELSSQENFHIPSLAEGVPNGGDPSMFTAERGLRNGRISGKSNDVEANLTLFLTMLSYLFPLLFSSSLALDGFGRPSATRTPDHKRIRRSGTRHLRDRGRNSVASVALPLASVRRLIAALLLLHAPSHDRMSFPPDETVRGCPCRPLTWAVWIV